MIRHALPVLAVAIVMACQPSTSPSPTGAPPSAPTPTTVVSGTWRPLELLDAVGFWRATGVVADADGFVVYGNVNDRPAAWTSGDATTWTSVALPGINVFPSAAAASKTATVLIGVGTTSQCAHPSGEFVWRRASGDEPWAGVPSNQALFCAGGFPLIAANDSTFVVAGAGTGDVPFAWHSDDGLTWQDAGQGLPIDVFPTVLGTTLSGFVLLGRGERTFVQTSPDGNGWTPAEAPAVPPAFNPNGPGMFPAALVETAAGTLAIYASDDASAISAWRRQGDGSWDEARMTGLESGDAIAEGPSLDGRASLFVTRQGRAALLTSTDLSNWTDVLIPDLASITGLATFASRSVLVGNVTDAAGDDHSLVFVADALP
jgi:hypothetical protein